MSKSGSGKPDLEGVDQLALSLNGVDPGCMNPITGSTCRAKCSNILHNNTMLLKLIQPIL